MVAPLTLELESAELRIGDTLRGVVRVEEDFAEAKGLDLEIQYLLRGSPHSRVKRRLVDGPIYAGREVPFELTLPDAPYSWKMPNVSVSWRAQASVDIAWRIDPKVNAELVVRPQQLPPSEEALAKADAAAEASKPDTSVGPLGSAILWLIVGGLALAFLPFLPLALIFWARSTVTQTRLRDVELVLPERRVAHGEWFPITVRFFARRPFEVAKLDLTLSGSERWSTGSGDSRRSHREVFFTESQTILPGRIVAIGVADAGDGGGGAYRGSGRRARQQSGPVFEWQTGFRLPTNAPPSAASGLTYDVKLRLDLPGLPDVTRDLRLKTLGAEVHPLPPAGDPPPPEVTSGELTILKAGDPVPAGVNARLGAGGLMRWVLLSFVGVALGIGGIVGLASGAAMAAIPLALGGALLALSVGAFLWTLYR